MLSSSCIYVTHELKLKLRGRNQRPTTDESGVGGRGKGQGGVQKIIVGCEQVGTHGRIEHYT